MIVLTLARIRFVRTLLAVALLALVGASPAYAEGGVDFGSLFEVWGPVGVLVLALVSAVLKRVESTTAKQIGSVVGELGDELKDRLDPDTHGGSGRGPENPAVGEGPS